MKATIKKIFRKVFMRAVSVMFFLLFLLKTEAKDSEKTLRPNIVVLVADDAGWNDVGYHGSEIKTPNIDRLVETGVELNQFYVYPTCSPTRASLLTGRYASRFGIFGPIMMRSKQVLPKDVETLPGLLKKAGYSTAITGKWHLGLRPENGPRQYGFDYTYGYLHGQIDQYTHRYKNGDRSWHRNDVFIDEEGHTTDLITNEVVKYITESRDKSKPFFIYVPYSVPHYPLQEEDKWIEPYKNLDDEDSRKIFAASVAHMDDSIGEILKTLEVQNLIENTLIIFLSDNGGQNSWTPTFEYEGKHGPYPKMGDNLPLRGEKTELFEGGIRVPAVINWKGKLQHLKIDELIKVTDVLPTVTSLVDPSLTEDLELDGDNIWPMLTGAKTNDKDRSLYSRTGDLFSYRKGDWKLIHFGESLNEGSEQLFNLKDDPYETKNVLENNRAMRDELFNELQREAKFDNH